MRPALRNTVACLLAPASEIPSRSESTLVVQLSVRTRRAAALVVPTNALSACSPASHESFNPSTPTSAAPTEKAIAVMPLSFSCSISACRRACRKIAGLSSSPRPFRWMSRSAASAISSTGGFQ
nr:hypothetical protein [uncultured bacterium]